MLGARLLGALLATALLALMAPAVASAVLSCDAGVLPGTAPAPQSTTQRLLFGISPGGYAGVIAGPQPPAKPDDPGKIDGAIATLRGGRPFVVHWYSAFSGIPAVDAAAIANAQSLTDHWVGRGFLVEWVVRYVPNPAPNVAGFASFIREFVRGVGARPGVHAVQVTNEANQSVSPDASDGAFAGARDALIQGVIAAKDEARKRGLSDLQIGFNWFYRLDPSTEESFWTYLAQGGAAFTGALDWVGLDAYPGTFFPPAGSETDTRDAMINAMSVLRDCYMPTAGIPSRVKIYVTENGWPTMPPGRSYATQEQVLRDLIGAVNDYRANYNVSDYRWYDLRDANSGDPRFDQQFGITRDDYTPKPAFGAYRELINRFGLTATGGGGSSSGSTHTGPVTPQSTGGLSTPGGCVTRGASATVRVKSRTVRQFAAHHPRAKLLRVDFLLDGVLTATRRRTPFSATIETAGLRPGRHRLQTWIYLRRRVANRRRTRTTLLARTLRATITVC